RTARQRLCPLQANATCCIGLEIEPANVRQDFLISVTSSEFAKAAGLVVDPEIKVIAGARFDKLVDEIFRIFFRTTFCRLLPQEGLVLRRHEVTARCEPFSLGHGE